MNWQEYSNSDKLAQYVLGTLLEKEMEEIRMLEQKHQELANEIDEVQSALLGYAEAQSPGLRNDFMQNIAFTKRQDTQNPLQHQQKAHTSANHEKSTQPDSNNPKVKQLQGRLANIRKVAATLIGIVLLSIVGHYLQYQRISAEREKITRLNAELQDYQQFEARIERTLEEQKSEYQKLLAIMNDPNTKIVALEGLAISPESRAMVFWNTQSHKVVLNAGSLPSTDAQHQYQLWALVDGTPVDAGVFNPHKEAQEVKSITKAQAFAVTLEPKGGSKEPTLSKLYVMGEVPGV